MFHINFCAEEKLSMISLSLLFAVFLKGRTTVHLSLSINLFVPYCISNDQGGQLLRQKVMLHVIPGISEGASKFVSITILKIVSQQEDPLFTLGMR